MKRKDSYSFLERAGLFFSYIGLFILRYLIYMPAILLIIYLFKDLYLFDKKYTSIPLYLGELMNTKFSGFHPGFPANILVALLEFVIALLLLAIFYLVIPILILGTAMEISSWSVVARIDAYNNWMYSAETNHGKPHKERLSGIEELEERKRKKDEREAKRSAKAREKILKERPGIIKGYYTNQMEQNDSSNDDYDIVEHIENKKIKAAFVFYGFGNDKFTKEQLEKQYKKMMVKYHPDVNSREDAKEMSEMNGEYYLILKSFKNWD
ncbi:hypothetical protein [Hungatella hathewayi]|uniref:hypothetical protein n=1 Tax=Hungatella hathewayi TaxID=154046 RepID=UPI00356A01D3